MAGSTPTPCPKGAKQFEPSGKGQLWIQWNTFGPEWSRTLGLVKTLELERPPFDSRGKYWIAKDTTPNRTKLLGWGFQLVGVPASIGLPGIPVRVSEPWEAPWSGIGLPDLPWLEKLRGYQREALQMLVYRKGRAGIFYDMGMGKTATSLSWVRMNPDIMRVVVIATASTKSQWVREARKWGLDLPFCILSGRATHALPNRGAVVINYDILEAWAERLLAWDPQCIIADEVQAVGNPKSKRSKAFANLARDRGLLALSGTPARTCPAQLFTVLHALDPTTFKDHFRYLYRYCDPKTSGFGTTFKGSTNAEELHEKIRPLALRYTKFDVLKDLPDRVYNPVLMDCTVSKEYEEAQDRILGLQGYSPAQLRERLSALTASAFELKKESVIEWISEFLETGNKLVVFGWHVAVLDYLEAHLGRQCVRVSGGVSKDARERAVYRFVNDAQCKVFLGNIQAAGVGIDGLQGVCSDVAFVELCWSPADLDQAESRLHRLGQRSSVTVHYLLASGTIDTVMAETLEARKNALRIVVDGKADANEDESIVGMLRNLQKGHAK